MRRARIVPGVLVLLASLGVPQAGGAAVPNPIVKGPISAGGIRSAF